MTRPPAFVDCYGDLEPALTDELLRIVPGLEVMHGKATDEDDLVGRLQGRKHVLVYMAYMSGQVLRACPEMRSVAYLSTGLATHGDLPEAARLGIQFEGVKGYGDRAVAEHAVGLAFAALKRVCEMDREVRAGRWQLMRSEELAGKTFGIVGAGGIGAETGSLAQALGARVIGYSRSPHPDLSFPLLPLDDVLAQSDILSLHLALVPDTENLIDAGAFGRMKRGVILINTARAGVICEDALVKALQSGQVGHACLDVFHQEPPDPGHPLFSLPNVTLTPHSAWLTTQSVDRLLRAGLRLLARHIGEG